MWWIAGCVVERERGRVGTGSTAPPNTAGLNGRGGWYWVPSPHSHHPHAAAPNPPEPPTSVRLPPRLPTHSPPGCRRGNNLQPNQHNVSSNNDFHPLCFRLRCKKVSNIAGSLIIRFACTVSCHAFASIRVYSRAVRCARLLQVSVVVPSAQYLRTDRVTDLRLGSLETCVVPLPQLGCATGNESFGESAKYGTATRESIVRKSGEPNENQIARTVPK